jgi:acyl-CoA reductase-like NAD-dependent aldehyde dehydrogenase
MQMIIDGKPVDTRKHLDVLNPATLETIDTVPVGRGPEIDRAVDAARRAFATWRKDVAGRRKALQRCAAVIQENMKELAELLTREQGKPLADAQMELLGCAMYFSYFSTLEYEERLLKEDDGHVVKLLRKPLGVVATITPWNFPLIILSWKIAPAILAGNTVVSKPAPTTPLSSVRLLELLSQTLPPGVVNLVTGDDETGELITKHPEIRKISFTGSTETGKRVMRNAADTLKRLTLELGGNDPAIVLDDVNLEEVAPAIFQSAVINAGQTCSAIKRLYAHESIYPRLVEKLSAIAQSWKVGNGLDPGVQMGPLNNRRQYERVKGLVEDARKRGARILGGGGVEGLRGYFLRPAIVTGLDDSAPLVAEEQFGPALPVLPFRDVDEALERANATHYGLSASVWSGNVARATELAKRIDAGTTWVNQHLRIEPDVPFGGQKESGIGREMGIWGVEEFCEEQVLNVRKA